MVYFFRESHLEGFAISYNVREDGKLIGAIANGTYFFVYSDPGTHKFSAATEAEVSRAFDVEAGKTYYIKCGVTIGFFAGRPSMEISNNEADAKALLPTLTYATKTPAQLAADSAK